MRVRRWLPLLILLAFLFFGESDLAAYPASAHPLAHPLDLSCYGDGGGQLSGCDGYKPPPLSICQNTQWVDVHVDINDHYDYPIGVLNLWESNANTGCASLWGDALDNSSTADWTVTAIGMWERNGDGSNKGGLDSMPHNLSPGKREDTFMVGMITCLFCSEGCYHVAIDYIDEYGWTGWADTGSPPYDYCTNY
ncbi:MAG TPA: hypothetical protein VKR42_04555 [Ktedonobacteraceae bacterium]|nr:hypothetical protein [Ktedonobacteraceae bacterium]